MFVLNSDIAIGSFRFSGVNNVRINRSLHSIVETATVTLPSIAKIVSGGKVNPGTVITGNQFSDGDPVIIKLGYNSGLQTEFRGFVKRRNLNMPLEVECEGYSWLLRRNNVNQFWKTVTVKDLLAAAVSGIDRQYKIEVVCEAGFELSNVNITNATGFEVINNVAKYTDGALVCFFIRPDVLWCGLIYTAYAEGNDVLNAGQASYRLGFNVVRDNSLKERLTENDPVEVKYSKKQSDGSKIQASSDVFKSFVRTHSKILNQVKDAAALKKLANEKAYHLNYPGYEGAVTGFLQPYAAPGYTAFISDGRYPERNGRYLIESTEVNFGVHGARRIVEVGPQMGFDK